MNGQGGVVDGDERFGKVRKVGGGEMLGGVGGERVNGEGEM